MEAAVIEVLRQAVSQDPNVLKSAEETLKQWETQQGFYIALYVSFPRWKPEYSYTGCNNILYTFHERTGFVERYMEQ